MRRTFLLPLVGLGLLAGCGGGSSHEASGPAGVRVTISPDRITLAPGVQHSFQATVTGTLDPSVIWTVVEGAAGGTITQAGLYTAPSTLGRYRVVATSVADRTKSATANVAVADATDLCGGLVVDKAAHAMTAVTKPPVGQAYLDPQFGTTIRRISDAAAASAGDIIPVYSTIQAWNADESYMFLYWVGTGTHHLYNGRTYAHIKALGSINPADIEQVYWDLTDPKILYYADRTARILYKFNVDTEVATAVHNFANAPTSCTADLTGGVDPMWTSWGPEQVFGFVCGTKHFSYDLATNTVGTVATVSSGGNHPAPGPSGQYFFLNVNDTAAQVRDANMTLLRTLSGISSAEHGSLGNADGVDTFFSVQWSTYEGTVVASNLATGANRVIVGPDTGWPTPPSGTHLSAVAYKRPGWLAVSVVGASNGAGVLDQELLLVNANTGGSVCRVGHHRSTATDYWAEPHVSISPSGTRLLFGSDWGGGAVVDSYVVELPGYHAP